MRPAWIVTNSFVLLLFAQGLEAKTLRLDTQTIRDRARHAPANLKRAIREAARRIAEYHKLQCREEFTLMTAEGKLSQKVVALQRVGVYIPGGYTVYPSSVLMNVIPAQIAKVPEIAAVTPPGRELDPGVAFALDLLQIQEVYQVGGAQAIAALAYGTKTIPAVDKVVGPGSAFVATAKRLVYGVVDIDSIAGPSEVAILADTSANPSWIALDLLAQAEHGSGNERAVAIVESLPLAKAIRAEILREIKVSPVKKVIDRLAPGALAVVVTASRKESISIINRMAPEHLQIMTKAPERDLKEIRNAAAVFLGVHTPVALGDYFIGTNHVLPTGGAARFSSPLGVDSFVKRMSVAAVTREGLRLSAPYVSCLARAESFVHHAMSVERRVMDSAKPRG